MRYKIFCYLWIFLLFLPLSAQPSVELAQKIKLLKTQIQARYGMVFEVLHGEFAGNTMVRNTKLDNDTNYRIFLLNARGLNELQATCTISPNLQSKRRTNTPDDSEYQGVECYHWFMMTFSSNSTIELTMNRVIPGNHRIEYAIVIASAGRNDWPEIRRMSDSSGTIYEIQGDNLVYRNGRKHLTIHRHIIKTLCVTTYGKIYMITTQGYVLHGNSLFLKKSNAQALWMVVGKNDSLYILFSNGYVYNRTGDVVYHRFKEHEAIDLIEDNGMVWIITREGKRIELCRPTVIHEQKN